MCMIIVDNISIFINFVCYVKKRNYTNYLWIKNEAFTFIHDFIHQLFNSVPEDIAIGNKNINREQRQMS